MYDSCVYFREDAKSAVVDQAKDRSHEKSCSENILSEKISEHTLHVMHLGLIFDSLLAD